MQKIHENIYILCFHVNCKHENMHVSMQIFHLVPLPPPHYIIMVKGELQAELDHVKTSHHAAPFSRGLIHTFSH